MKLHLPKSLRHALLACLTAIAPMSFTITTGAILLSVATDSVHAATTVGVKDENNNNITTLIGLVNYAGYALTLDFEIAENYNGNGNPWESIFHSATFTYQSQDGSTTRLTGTTTGGPLNQTTWQYFANGNINNVTGNTLILKNATKNTDIETQFSAVSLGGLIVEKSDYEYSIGRISGDAHFRLEAALGVDVNLSIDSNFRFASSKGQSITVCNGGTWNVSEGKTLSSGDMNTIFEENIASTINITGKGTVDLSGGTTEIKEGTTLCISEESKLYLKQLSGLGSIRNDGYVDFSGKNRIGQLYNNGIINFQEDSSLFITYLDNNFYDGFSMRVGQLQGISDYSNVSTLFGYDNESILQYDSETGTVTITYDAIGYYWDGKASSYNWSSANMNHKKESAVISDGAHLHLTQDAEYKTVHMDTTVNLEKLFIQADGYTFHVTADNTLPSSFHTTDSGYGITKTGNATLHLTSTQALQLSNIAVNEGTLKLTDTLASAPLDTVKAVNLTHISASSAGILSIIGGGSPATAGASANNGNKGPTVTSIQLGESFNGVLSIEGGKISITKSTLGNADSLIINGGGILISSNGSAFGQQVQNLDINVGDNGAFIDHYGSSLSKQDTWSSKHTGSFSGKGKITFIGLGEWILAGNYNEFYGEIVYGEQAQRLYISSSMEHLTQLLDTTVREDADVVVGYNNTNGVTVSVSGDETISQNNKIYLTNNSVFNHNGGISISDNKTLTIEGFQSGSGTYNVSNISFGAGSKLDIKAGIDVNINATNTVTVTQGELAIAAGASVNDARKLTLDGELIISGGGSYKQQGTLTVNDGSSLTFDGIGLIDLESAINNSGKVEFLNQEDTQIQLSDKLLTHNTAYHKEWNIIGGNGSIIGWDILTENNFLIGDKLLSQGDWDSLKIENGKVSLTMLYEFWDSVGNEPSIWDTQQSTVWRDADGTDDKTYEAGAQVAFGQTDDDNANVELNKNVHVISSGVDVKNMSISGTNYLFSGGDIRITDMLQSTESAVMTNALVIADATTPLQINVADNTVLQIADLKTTYIAPFGTPVYGNGAFEKDGAGRLTITRGIHGTITEASISEGSLKLENGVTLTVGANSINGGIIENTVLQTSGSVTRSVVNTLNIIRSANDTEYAVLTDVKLKAGTSDAFATLQKVTFAGNSELSGYITFEETQHANEINVAAGSELYINGLIFDLRGLAAGEKILIDNAATGNTALGTISGWDSVQYVYSGIQINSEAINAQTNGTITIKTDHNGNLYWDGSENNSWDAISTNWSLTESSDGTNVFTALSNIYFGYTPEEAQKDISIKQDAVVANLYITQGGYNFSGSRLAALGDISLSPADGTLSMGNSLIAQGNISVSGDAAITLNGEISAGGNLTFNTNAPVSITNNVSVGGDFNIGTSNTAVIVKNDKSTIYNISGNVTASNVLINIESAPGASSDNDNHLLISGNITATGDRNTETADGTVTILGSAAKHFSSGVVADTLYIDNNDTERNTLITFTGIIDVNTLEIAANSFVRISNPGSDMDNVLLGGTLYMDSLNVTYNKGYNIYSTDDEAEIVFGNISTNTISLISGLTPNAATTETPQYHSINVNANTRFLTVNGIENLKDLRLYNGPMTVQSGTGAIHGSLIIEQGASLNLTNSANNIMSRDSRDIYVEQATINLNSTTQTLGENNILWLSTGTISGATGGAGLVYTEDTGTINYAGRNTISANISVNKGTTLTIIASKQLEDLLTISGNISGSGNIEVKNDGILQLNKANSFEGSISMFGESMLALSNRDALAHAHLILKEGSLLYADASNSPHNIKTLTLEDGASMQLSGITAADTASAQLSVLHLGELEAIDSDLTLNLQLVFNDGELENMKTYNLFSSDTAVSIEKLRIELSVIQDNLSTHVDSNQYTLGYDATENVVYLRTMLGYIWDGRIGQDNNADGIWSSNQKDTNWSGKYYDGETAYNDAIFVDLANTTTATVTIEDTVTPGDIYFESNTTAYVLTNADGGKLEDGTNIHKAGSSNVTLSLTDAVLGDIDVANGVLLIQQATRIQGEASVEAGGRLQAKKQLSLGKYTITGDFSNMVMNQQGVTGSKATAPGIAMDAVLDGAAIVNNIRFEGDGSLTDAIISSGVSVAENSLYTLSGTITFNNTLVNAGTVNFADGMLAELGKLEHSDDTDLSGKTTYTYQLIDMVGEGKFGDEHHHLTKDSILINGVNLNSGLADNIATVHSFMNGELSISIGNITSDAGEPLTVDGSVGIPYWDARWGKENTPALTRIYINANQGITDSIANNAGYLYNTIVNAANAAAVNGGKAVSVTLAAGTQGNTISGGASGESSAYEMWIYDLSDIQTVIAGQNNAGSGVIQSADTHIFVNSGDVNKDKIIGGSYQTEQRAESYLTIQGGIINNVFGATQNGHQTGTSHVYINGGTIQEIFAGGYDGNLVGTQQINGSTRAVELIITGGTLGYATNDTTKRVFAGGHGWTITGDIYVRMEGNARVETELLGGSNGGTINGNIVMDLVSGTAVDVHAAGNGWTNNNSTVNGSVIVNLYRDFNTDSISGGKQNNSFVIFGSNGSSNLHFAEAGEYEFATWTGEAAGTESGSNTGLSSYVTIQGFDTISLSDKTIVTVDTNYFDRNIDTNTDALVITGNGILQLGGSDNSNNGAGSKRRAIRLENGATLKIISSYTAKNFSSGTTDANKPYQDYEEQSAIYVTDGTTLDISGYPRENNAGDGGGSIAYRVYLSGDGVDGKGALYKNSATGNHSTNPSGKMALGYIELEKHASITADGNANIIQIGSSNSRTELILNENILTKRGQAAYALRNTDITEGTIYVHEGTLRSEGKTKGVTTDVVLTANSTLLLEGAQERGSDVTQGILHLRSLSGSGQTSLQNYNLYLTPHQQGKFYESFLNENNSWDNLMNTTGFAYGVYSGEIHGSGAVYIGDNTNYANYNGTQYLSNENSTYSGGTHVESGRLYLLSTTIGTVTKGSTTVTSGPIGTGTLYWDAEENAEVYLGNGVTVYNAGTTFVQGADNSMIIGVEGAHNGERLNLFAGVNGTVTKDGITYREVDTHNLYSISCNGIYADGSLYTANTEIDRNKMLLVSEEAWNAESSTVMGFSDTGYNEATYSGVLSGSAALVKVGAGTLVIDQANAYTGGTRITKGTLKLKGWAQIGAAADGTVDVIQTEGSTLMLAYDGSYGNDELTEIANDIILSGTGDVRWVGAAETGGATAALISDVGSAVKFTLSGDISGSGNLLHSGEGTLVLSGDSDFTGGMQATGGIVEVQSATGLGATANGSNKVIINAEADLKVSVKDGYTGHRMTTSLAAEETDIKGDVVIQGSDTTERILHMATNGYASHSTTANENGTLLVNGEGVSATSALLTGSGKVAVSDATGSGAHADIGTLVDYTGDFAVEGPKASINTNSGNFIGGSISVQGQDASVNIGGNVTISAGQELILVSNGTARNSANTAAMITSGGILSVAGGATFSVSNDDTEYNYNLQELRDNTSLSLADATILPNAVQGSSYYQIGKGEAIEFNGFFDKDLAINQQAAGAVNAANGLVLSGGSTYETNKANTSLMGGSLTLATSEDSLISFVTSTEMDLAAALLKNPSLQLVLFTDVSSVTFGAYAEAFTATEDGVYYALANQFLTGSPYIGDETLLVYDAHVGVVYLDRAIPEPTTVTLSLLALAALAARRRRK